MRGGPLEAPGDVGAVVMVVAEPHGAERLFDPGPVLRLDAVARAVHLDGPLVDVALPHGRQGFHHPGARLLVLLAVDAPGKICVQRFVPVVEERLSVGSGVELGAKELVRGMKGGRVKGEASIRDVDGEARELKRWRKKTQGMSVPGLKSWRGSTHATGLGSVASTRHHSPMRCYSRSSPWHHRGHKAPFATLESLTRIRLLARLRCW